MKAVIYDNTTGEIEQIIDVSTQATYDLYEQESTATTLLTVSDHYQYNGEHVVLDNGPPHLSASTT